MQKDVGTKEDCRAYRYRVFDYALTVEWAAQAGAEHSVAAGRELKTGA